MSNVTVMRIGPTAVVVDNLLKIERHNEVSIKLTYVATKDGTPITEILQCSYDQFWSALKSSPAQTRSVLDPQDR